MRIPEPIPSSSPRLWPEAPSTVPAERISHRAVPAAADLLGLYTFENVIADQSGKGNDPVAQADVQKVTFASGIDGMAAVFDGANSYIDVPINIKPGVVPQLTMGAWVKSDVTTGSHGILSHDNFGWNRSIGVRYWCMWHSTAVCTIPRITRS